MMQKNFSTNGHTGPQTAPKNRLWLKLAALFAATFLVVFFGGLVVDVFGSMMDRSRTDAAAVPPAPIIIDPRLKTELNRVMAFDTIPSEIAVSDPFVDRGGLSASVRAANGTPTVQPASATARQPAAAGTATSTAAKVGGTQTSVVAAPQPPAVSPTAATKERFANRLERVRLGLDGGAESAVFAIDDLLPVGVVSGGSGHQEIIFFSQAANQTFSFPVGTRFFDGWLTEIRPEGVVFTFDDQHRTKRMRSWGRSIKAQASAGLPVGTGNSTLAQNGK